ncbi:MAG: hypothetical protein NC350_01315 [Corallococcus sp.]|nr:hypothetical protein [Corallococcus sp.]
MSPQKEKILQMLRSGVITKEQASDLLDVIGEDTECHDAMFDEKMKKFESKFQNGNQTELNTLQSRLDDLRIRLDDVKKIPFDVIDEDLSDIIDDALDEVDDLEEELTELDEQSDEGYTEEADGQTDDLRSAIDLLQKSVNAITKRAAAIAQKGIEIAKGGIKSTTDMFANADAVIHKNSAIYTGNYEDATVYIKYVRGDFKFTGDYKVGVLLANRNKLTFLSEKTADTINELLNEKFCGDYKCVNSMEILKVRIC